MSGLGRRSFVWGLAAFGAFVAIFAVFGALGWPGAPDSCVFAGNCFCEASHGSEAAALGKQPANTWSNVSAVLAGLWILAVSDRERAAGGAARNPMTSGGFFAVLYGAVVLFLGPGSMAFHGSLTRVGGWLDTFSMIAFITFLIAYDGSRVLAREQARGPFVIAYPAALALLGGLTWLFDGTGTLVFGMLAVVALVTEVVISARGLRGIRRRAFPWLLLALATFAVALVVWRLSWTRAPLCDPSSLLQGHAVWHGLAEAVAPLLIFLYMRTEEAHPLPS